MTRDVEREAGERGDAPDRLPLPRVAIVSPERFPHHGSNTQQVIKNADALAGAGLPVELLIPLQWKGLFRPGYSAADAIRSYYNVPPRLTIRELPPVPASDLRIEKVTHALASLLYVRRRGHDVVYTRNGFTAVLSVTFGFRTVFETYRQFGAEYPRRMGWMARYARRPNLLGIILHSQMASDSLRKVGFPEQKLIVLHNGFDPADLEPALTRGEARRALGWDPTTPRVVYTGNLHPTKGVESIVDLAGRLPGVSFVLVGGTADEIGRLEARAAARGVRNVLFAGHHSVGDVSTYLYAADVLIIPPSSTPLQEHRRTVLPLKTFLYLAAGRPVVAPRQPDLMEVLRHGANAILVEPDDTAACAAALESLLADAPRRRELSEAASASARHLTWEGRARSLIRWLVGAYHGVRDADAVVSEESERGEPLAGPA